MLLEQSRHSKGGEAGGQGIAQQRGVAAIHDRSNDRGVGRRPADALLLQHLHQRCLAEPCRRLGLMAKGFNGLRLRCIANAQRRQQHFLTLKGRIGIIAALHVGAEETGKVDALAAGPETGLARAEIHRQHREPGLRHLAGHGAFPDQFIDRQISPIQTGVTWRSEAFAGWTNRFMGLLGIAGFGAELPRPLLRYSLP